MLLLLTMLSTITLPLQTLTEWATVQIADLKTLLIKGASLVVLALALWRCAKSNFAIGAILMTLIVGALAYWVTAGDGIQTISSLISDQAKQH